MAKDDRLYFKVTLDFPDHAKILPLSDAAFRCLIEAIAYCRKHLTDGFLARRYALARWAPEVLAELCTNDPVKPSLIEREDGWHIHDYADMNETAAEVEARRERNRQAGKQGGLAKAKRDASKSLGTSVSENVAETETEKEKELTTDVVSSRPRKRGTRLPDGWMPTQEVVDSIKAETGATREQLSYQHRKFLDYWTSKAGSGATKVDWLGTWRNWMRTACERGEIGHPQRNGARPNKLRALADLAAEVREMETGGRKELA